MKYHKEGKNTKQKTVSEFKLFGARCKSANH